MRKAFSLIEVIIVISILFTLLGIILPAVHSARESARAAACHNNLKQIGTAFQLHEQSLGHLPGGGWGSAWTGDPDLGFGASQPGGWAFSLLPYMDQTNLHAMSSDGDPESITEEQRDRAAEASRMPIEILSCPSRRPQGVGPLVPDPIWNMNYTDSVSKTDYAANAGDSVVLWGEGPTPDDVPFGRGFKDMGLSTGVVHQASQIKSGHLVDGLSNTYLAGEKRMCISDPSQDDHGALFGADADNARWTQDLPGQDSHTTDATFGSSHPYCFGMLLCDGAVRPISYEIDQQTHSRLGNRRDGQIAMAP